jgi:hypothetical protein
MMLQPARKIEAFYWLLCIAVLAILCSCSEKKEEYGPYPVRFAMHTGYHDYQQFVGENQ